MELEGLGVSLTGRAIWSYSDPVSIIPWEFIQNINHTMKLLILSRQSACHAVERDWTCIWQPVSSRDWSCIATIVRSIPPGGSCLIAFDECSDVPQTFWAFLEGILRDGRVVVTRIWINTSAPPWIPDAVFFPPPTSNGNNNGNSNEPIKHILQALPARNGHGALHILDDWNTLVQATSEQDLGIVVSDVEENRWTLLWWRPADSRGVPDHVAQRCIKWIEAAAHVLKGIVTR
jgi:hypothetical protein